MSSFLYRNQILILEIFLVGVLQQLEGMLGGLSLKHSFGIKNFLELLKVGINGSMLD